MAVAFVCNMNNHFFAAVRHVRERGVDAHLILLNDEATHFHPSYDTFDRSFQKYTHLVEWGDPMRFSRASASRIRDDLAPYAKIVACGSAPAFALKAGRQCDVFIPYGADVLELPFFRLAPPRRGAVRSLWEFPRAQRRAIRGTPAIGGARAVQFEEALDRIRARGRRVRVPIPPVYATDFNPEQVRRYAHRSNWYEDFEAIRKSSDLVLFHHARHIWASRSTALNYKGNDKLIRGFAEFVKRHEDVKPALICIEYDVDVAASKRLAAELGVDQYIHWFPVMARKELMLGIALSDIVCGEFSVSWNFGGTIIEALTMAKPLLHYRDDTLYPRDELFPIMNASNAEEIRDCLERFVATPAQFEQMGRDAHAWFLEHVVERGTRTLVDLVTH